MRWWVTLGIAIGLAGLFGFADRSMSADLEKASADQAVRAARAEANWLALLLEKRLNERARALEVVAQGTSEGSTARALRAQRLGVSAKAWVQALRSQYGPWIEVALVDEAGVVQEASPGGSALGRPKVVTVALEGQVAVGLHRFGTALALVAASPVPGKRVAVGAVVVALRLEAATLRRWIPKLPEGSGLALLDDKGLVAHTLAGDTDWPSKLGLTADGRYVSQRTSRFGALRVQTVAALAPPGQTSVAELASFRMLLLGILAFVVAAAGVWVAPVGGRSARRRAKDLDLLSMPLNVPPIPVPDLTAAKTPAVQPLPVHPPAAPSSSGAEANGVQGISDDPEPVTPVQEAPFIPPGDRRETPAVRDPHAQTTMPSMQAPRPPLFGVSDAEVQRANSRPGSSRSDARVASASSDHVSGRAPAASRSGTDDLIAQIPLPSEQSPPPIRPPPPLRASPSPSPRPHSDTFDAIANAAQARPTSPSTPGPAAAEGRPRDGHLGSRAWSGDVRDSELPAPRIDLPAPTTIPPEFRARRPDIELPESWDTPRRAGPTPSAEPESPEDVPLPAPVGYRADLLAPKDMSAVPLPPSQAPAGDLWGGQSVPPGVVAPSPSAPTVVPGPPPSVRPSASSAGVPTPLPPSISGLSTSGLSISRSGEIPPPPSAETARPEFDSGPAASESRPLPFDEDHYRGVYDRFVQAKTELGQSLSSVSWEAFRTKLRSSEQTLLDQHGCRAVRFQVLVRERTVSLRPQLIR